MLCNGDNAILQIVGVEHMRWNSGTFRVASRDYSALAFRIVGNAVIRSNGKEHYINANDILYLPQNMEYTATYTDTEVLVVHFITARDDSELEIYSFQNSEHIYKLFLQIYSLWKNKEAGFTIYAMSLLYFILGTILEKETKTRLPSHFIKAISFINANYQKNNISVDLICKETGISATAFRQLFKKHYQKTPTEYITDLRLEYARNLISEGVPIKNVAYESGFNDPKYFARVVKKRFGCTPKDLKVFGK